jgi:hypothetical protein
LTERGETGLLTAPLSTDARLRATTGFLLALVIAAGTGLGLTWWSIANGPRLGAMSIGPWRAWPQIGGQDADRYARASVARSGELPLAAGEGIAFLASEDSQGAALSGQCRYRIAPIGPPARWWTLTLYDGARRLFANPAERYAFTSAEVVRGSDGEAAIVAALAAEPGNWLPSPAGRFQLVLRLYDTPISTGLAAEEAVALPAITAEGCS